MRLFLSYHLDAKRVEHEHFVFQVSYHLRRQRGIEAYCYADDPRRQDWQLRVGRNVLASDGFVLFVGAALGKVQRDEAAAFAATGADQPRWMWLVTLPGYVNGILPPDLFQASAHGVESGLPDGPISDDALARASYACAHALTRLVARAEGRDTSNDALYWAAADGAPLGYPYDYEKALIDDYKANGRLAVQTRIEQGCPLAWPDVARVPAPPVWDNPVDPDSIGKYRDHRIRVDARECDPPCAPGHTHELTLPEAGPRAKLCYPAGDRQQLTIAVVVSGGIAPGINAVIDGIVERQLRYWRDSRARRGAAYDLQILFYRNGFTGLLNGDRRYLDYEGRLNRQVGPPIPHERLRRDATRGGASTGTSRHDPLLDSDCVARSQHVQQAIVQLSGDQVDILYVIGGDGSMRAAHALWTRSQELRRAQHAPPHPLSVVAIPKTMDNDILWVWQSFGFLSAVERAKESVLQLHTEVSSNPRLCIIQLFGSDSGFVVSHTALASGVCDAALIPEVNFTLAGLSQTMRTRLEDRRGRGDSPGGLILLAETAVPRDVEDYIDNENYDLGLDGVERDAVCEFVGSSLLTASDVVDWAALLRALGEGQHGDGSDAMGLVRTRLSAEVRALVREDWGSLRDKDSIRRLILRAVSEVIRERSLFGELRWEPPLLKDLQATLGAVEELSRGQSVDLRPVLERVVLPPNHDAKQLLLDLTAEPARPVSPDDVVRLAKRLVEITNRRVLEAALGEGVLRPVDARTSAHRDRRIHGQTPDELRRGGLKIIARVLQADIRNPHLMTAPYWRQYRVSTNEPRHLLRAIRPSVTDVIFGHRLGTLAVDNAMAGYSDFMVSQWLTEYVLVPLQLVVLGRKRVRQDGIFWKSVLANTGQP